MHTPPPPIVVSLDIGTSSVRSAAYDGTGRLVEETLVGLPHDVHSTPDGGAELGAEELVEGALTTLAETDARLRGLRLKAEAVSVCTFWHSLLGADGARRAVTPVYIWSDTRSAELVAQLRERLDESECHRRTGCVFHTSYWPAKLLWLREHDPATFAEVRWWMSLGEYLFLRLFGVRACSHSMASGTGLLNHQTMGWDDVLLDSLDMAPESLSPVVDECGGVAGVGDEFVNRLGRLAAAPWYVALGDGSCSNVGSGGVLPDRATLMIGTSGAMRVMPAGEVDPPWGVWKYRADRQRCLLGGALSNGGNLTYWLSKTLRLESPAQCEEQLRSRAPDSHGLTVLPFVSGERSPNWRPDATGALLGLRLSTEPVQILHACLEAVAYRFALLAELLDEAAPGVQRYLASGGALLESPFCMQMLADVLGRPVVESVVPEASSRGAALLALEAMGALPSITHAEFPAGRTFQPNEAKREAYARGLSRHRRAYDDLRHAWT